MRLISPLRCFPVLACLVSFRGLESILSAAIELDDEVEGSAASFLFAIVPLPSTENEFDTYKLGQIAQIPMKFTLFAQIPKITAYIYVF